MFVHSYVSFALFKVVLYSEGIYTTNTNDFIHSNCTVLITIIPLLNHYAKKHFNLVLGRNQVCYGRNKVYCGRIKSVMVEIKSIVVESSLLW